MIRVLIVDDQTLFRESLATMLATDPDLTVLATASQGYEAMKLIEEHQPEVVLMDVQMPGLNGIAVTSWVYRNYPTSYVLLLTAFDDDRAVIEGLQAGAVGYLLKNTLSTSLIDSIKTAAQGSPVLPTDIHPTLLALLHRHQPLVRAAEPLSDRDQRILQLIALGKSNREIGDMLTYSPGTVGQYIRGIFTKLGVHDRAHAIAIAKDLGLI